MMKTRALDFIFTILIVCLASSEVWAHNQTKTSLRRLVKRQPVTAPSNSLFCNSDEVLAAFTKAFTVANPQSLLFDTLSTWYVALMKGEYNELNGYFLRAIGLLSSCIAKSNVAAESPIPLATIDQLNVATLLDSTIKSMSIVLPLFTAPTDTESSVSILNSIMFYNTLDNLGQDNFETLTSLTLADKAHLSIILKKISHEACVTVHAAVEMAIISVENILKVVKQVLLKTANEIKRTAIELVNEAESATYAHGQYLSAVKDKYGEDNKLDLLRKDIYKVINNLKHQLGKLVDEICRIVVKAIYQYEKDFKKTVIEQISVDITALARTDATACGGCGGVC